MKLLLDEMWSATIAVQLRRRGHDVVAVSERADLRSRPDSTVFAIAQAEGRTIVTDNVEDLRPLGHQELSRGRSHAGFIFTTNRHLPRHDERTPGRLISALDDLLRSGVDGTNLEYWLS